jgi:hypothetical protein
MTSQLYDSGREGFLDGTIDWDTDTIKIDFIRTSAYTFSAAHKFRSSVTSLAIPQTLGTKTVVAGVADAADATFTAVTAGALIDGVVIYKDNGSAAADRMICFIDANVTPNGGNITAVFDNGANKIFKL